MSVLPSTRFELTTLMLCSTNRLALCPAPQTTLSYSLSIAKRFLFFYTYKVIGALSVVCFYLNSTCKQHNNIMIDKQAYITLLSFFLSSQLFGSYSFLSLFCLSLLPFSYLHINCFLPFVCFCLITFACSFLFFFQFDFLLLWVSFALFLMLVCLFLLLLLYLLFCCFFSFLFFVFVFFFFVFFVFVFFYCLFVFSLFTNSDLFNICYCTYT